MECIVKYMTWKKMDIPNEILKTFDEEAIAQEVFNKEANCMDVKEVYGIDGFFYVENN